MTKGLNLSDIQVAYFCIIYPCLILQYMGQAAFLSKNLSAAPMSFYASVPGKRVQNLNVMGVTKLLNLIQDISILDKFHVKIFFLC